MTTMYIVRFVPLRAGPHTDAYFRHEAEALDVFQQASHAHEAGKPFIFADEFGVRYLIDTRQHTVVLTDSMKAAAFTKALAEANHEAQRTYGLVPQSIGGSSTH